MYCICLLKSNSYLHGRNAFSTIMNSHYWFIAIVYHISIEWIKLWIDCPSQNGQQLLVGVGDGGMILPSCCLASHLVLGRLLPGHLLHVLVAFLEIYPSTWGTPGH